MTDPVPSIEALRKWYDRDGLRSFIEKEVPDRIESLDKQLDRIQSLAEAAERPLPVCFLGNSGVGKSTLINALVGGRYAILPAGGVGPLTAQATRVKFSPVPYFAAEYHGRQRVNKMLFAIEREHERQLARDGAPTASGPASELSPEDIKEVEASLAQPDPKQGPSEKVAAYMKQVALLVRGNQFDPCDPGYLIDALRWALGQQARWGTAPHSSDEPRLKRLRDILSAPTPKPLRREDGGDRGRFLQELAEHAAGFLAPLISRLEVGWDHPLLQGGLELVDLPGVGVANDHYPEITAAEIRRARAVVLVTDKSGVRTSDADLLSDNGFITSLFHEQGEDADPPRLLIAVTKLDEPAGARRTAEHQHNPSAPRRPFAAIFEELSKDAVVLARQQLETELRKRAGRDDSSTSVDRAAIIERILSTATIHALSANEYRKLMEADEDAPARLKLPEQTHVPDLSATLASIVEGRATRVRTRVGEETLQWITRARSAVELTVALWEGEQRAEQEAQRLQGELDVFAASYREELKSREGDFRNFLKETIPSAIRERVNEASIDAQKDMRRHLRAYQDYPWQTIRAAIRKGGAFNGARNIDLPIELTHVFEEPVALVWSKHILQQLRKRTRAMGEDHVAMVEPIVGWARAQGNRVNPKVVEALFEELKAETAGLGNVGRDAIDELKDQVKQELYKHVEKRVRARCQKFVDDQEHIGVGVKRRMLELIDDLADGVMEEARPAAQKVLLENYEPVQAEIRDVFRKRANPIARATGAIVSSHEDSVKRSDAQRRRHVLERAREVLACAPAGALKAERS